MKQFLNPYNFVRTSSATDKISSDRIAAGMDPSIRHDAWTNTCKSGRIVCRLETRSPVVIGADRKPSDADEKPNLIGQYRRGKQVAIPGSSLRGTVGSTLELLSQSAMRVLEDKNYTVRKPVSDGLKMIGWLQKLGGTWQIVPYCVTSLAMKNQDGSLQKFATYNKVFRDQTNGEPMPLRDILPAYIYSQDLERLPDAKSGDQLNAELSLGPDKSITLQDIHRNRHVVDRLAGALHTKPSRSKTFILGQRIEKGPYDEPQIGTRTGWFRALGMHGRQEILPPGKRYEFFLPEPAELARPLIVDDSVIERFFRLGRERHEEDPTFPLHLAGQESWEDLHDAMVYFDASIEQGELVVNEISLSSIWRKEVKRSVHDWFQKIDKDLMPWSGARDQLTPAERILGVVSSNQPSENETLPALAGRVRFFDAVLIKEEKEDELLMRETKLHILSSPKPPSPAMYFAKSRGESLHVSKSELADDARNHEILPRGRKVYLPQPRTANGDLGKAASRAPEDDSRNKQRVMVRPIKVNKAFRFHVDFENLGAAELSLLLKSLDPGSDCVHRIGLGKSLGLGSVRIDVEAVAIRNRDFKDYRPSALDNPPESALHVAESCHEMLPDEVHGILSSEGTRPLSNSHSALASLKKDRSLIDEEALAQLQTAMNPEFIRSEVCYPRTEGQLRQWCGAGGHEDKLFEWFSDNERNRAVQSLGEIEPGEPLPPLQGN